MRAAENEIILKNSSKDLPFTYRLRDRPRKKWVKDNQEIAIYESMGELCTFAQVLLFLTCQRAAASNAFGLPRPVTDSRVSNAYMQQFACRGAPRTLWSSRKTVMAVYLDNICHLDICYACQLILLPVKPAAGLTIYWPPDHRSFFLLLLPWE